jgi:DNA-binding CsgD family transcriptional regulator
VRTVCEIANTISALSLAPDPDACSEIFHKAVSRFAIDAFSCGEVDLNVLERRVFYSISWPVSFRRFYFGGGMMRRDPMIDALRVYREPFTWSDLRRERKWKKVGTEGLQVIADHGWTEGLAVPIPRGGERFGLVSMMFRDRQPDAPDKSLLAMLSYSFHERLRNLVHKHGFALPPAGLTRREIDTLKLIALGDTDRKVAGKLGISPATAHEHFEKAKRKLKVSTRAGAIAVAVSLGIIAA